jgi:hypothetical protein
MAQSVLLNHPPPYADETLASWLWRLAQRNYVHSPVVLFRHLRDTVPKKTVVLTPNLTGMRDPALFVALAEITNSSVEIVHQHTIHRFAQIFTTPDQQVAQLQISSDSKLPVLSGHSTRNYYTPRFAWCPDCLAEARYVRLHWHIPFVTCCEVHSCWLLEECPACQMRLKEPDILSGNCSGCQFCLEQAGSIPVPSGDWLLVMTSTMIGWLYGHMNTTLIGLPTVQTAALLRVLQGLRSAVQRAGNEWDFHHVPMGTPIPNLDIVKQRYLTLFERGCLYATAFRALLDWPYGFWAFLDAYRRRPAAKKESGLRREFGVLYISWMMRFWKHPAFHFIQNAFNDYLVDQVPVYQIMDSSRIRAYPDLVDQFDYLDRKRATAYLNICISSIHRLVAEKNLASHHFEGDLDVWFVREELDRLKQKWRKHLTRPQVVQRLGVSLEAVQVLAEAGLLRVIPIEEGIKEQKTYIDEDSVCALIDELQKHTVIQANNDHGGVLLRAVCVRNASVKMNTVQLLKRVLAGKLLAYHPHEALFPLRAMWFAAEDVETLYDMVKDEQNWFNKEDVKAYLGVGWRAVRQLIAVGFLSSKMSLGRKQFFCQADVQAVKERWIFVAEIRRILKVPASCISQLVQYEILQPVSVPVVKGEGCYIFDRADFMTWHQEHILIPEMRTLTSNLKALQRRLKTKGVEPIVKIPNVYSRKEVMAVINQ